MKSYDWYNIINLNDFDSEDLTSKELNLILEGRDLTQIFIFKGVGYAVKWDNTFLVVELNQKNAYEFEDHAVYLDENRDLWIGYVVNEI